MVAGLFPSPDVAVDAGAPQPFGGRPVEQEMIDPETGIAGEGVSEILPEGEDSILWVRSSFLLLVVFIHLNFTGSNKVSISYRNLAGHCLRHLLECICRRTLL